MKTAHLIDQTLNWAVGYAAHGRTTYVPNRDNYSTCWNKGGPIIERLIAEGFRLEQADYGLGVRCIRIVGNTVACQYGATPLIAAMRCFVALKLGAEVDVPKELMSPAAAPPAPTEADHCFPEAQGDFETKGPAP